MRAEDVYQCGKCGLCLAQCPVYQVTRDETTSPRAKVQLIKHFAHQGMQASSHLRDLVSTCLMCGACSSFCPSGVDHDSLFMRMRSQMTDNFGENWRLRIVYHLLSQEQKVEYANQFARMGQKVLSSLSATRVGDIPVQRLPRLNKRPFRKQIAEVHAAQGKERGRILYFTGCATHYLYDQVGWSVLQVLTALGYRVEVPK